MFDIGTASASGEMRDDGRGAGGVGKNAHIRCRCNLSQMR